jgi:hypothetical protein
MSVNLWSQTAATNATIDPTVNFRENQAPSTVNNSARAMMAAVAKWRDDQSGNIATGGSSTAYTITSNQSLTPLVDGYTVTARMHTTSGASPTLNVDATGAKAIRTHTSTAVVTGALPGGSTHRFVYDSGDDCWYVANFFNNAITVDLATQVTGTLAIANGGTGEVTAAAAFGALKQAATSSATGVVEHASDAEIRAATSGNLVVTAASLESAAALVTLTDAATIAVDWDTFINSIVTMAGNRTLGNPTNLQAGTWRTIWIQGNDGTDRTITLSGNYLGPNVATWNALTFNSSTKRYIMSIYSLNGASAVLVGAPLGPF